MLIHQYSYFIYEKVHQTQFINCFIHNLLVSVDAIALDYTIPLKYTVQKRNFSCGFLLKL